MPRALVVSALSAGTGSGLRARYLARALERLGWETVFAAPAGAPLPYSAEIVSSAPRLLAEGSSRFDLAVGVKPYPNAWLALGLAGLRGAVTVMDVDDDDGGYRGGALGLLTRLIQAPGFRATPLLSTHHPLLRAKLAAAHGTQRVLDLPQGVDTGIFQARKRRQPRPESLRDASPLLAFTAHLNIACQLDVLLEALGPWLRAHPKAVLAIAGDGPDAERFRALAAPFGRQVRFLGRVDPQGAAALLACADASLSAYGPGEGNRYRVPMKVAESLAVGVPVVTNLVPGLRPLAPYLYVSELVPKAFGRALDRALRSGDGRTRRGQRFVREELDWGRVAAGFLKQIRLSVPALPRGAHEPR
jgi:glycosyltransferase involved in cell wall biosynthesis